jgi:hypothetical protein
LQVEECSFDPAKRLPVTRPGPDPRNNAPRAVVAGLIGAEAGAAVGLLLFGGVPFAPLGLAAAGAVGGFVGMAGFERVRRSLVMRGIRRQLRGGRGAPGGEYAAEQ